MKAIINWTLILALGLASSCMFSSDDDAPDSSNLHKRNEIEALLDEGDKAYKNKEYDKAEKLYDQVIAAAEQHGHFDLLADCQNSKGIMYYVTYRYKSSIFCYKRASELYLTIGNKNLAGKSLRNLGQAYRQIGIFDDALVVLLKSLKLLDQKDNEKMISSCFNMIAMIYKELGDFESSLNYHNKALKLRKKIDYKRGIAGSYQNIGNTYFYMDELNEALKFFNHALIIKEELGNKNTLATTFYSIGKVYFKHDEFALAEKYFMRSFELWSDTKNKYGVLACSNKLGNFYTENNKNKKARKYLNIAQELANELQSNDELATNHLNFKELYLKENKFSEALKHSDAYLKIYDQILNEKKAKSIITNKIKFEVDQINKEITVQKEKVAELTQHKTVLSIGATMTLVIAFLFYYLFHQKKKSEARVQQLLKDTHHRVKNNLQALSGMLSYQAFQLQSTPAKEVITEVENRMRAIMYIHKRLCAPREEALADISFKDYIHDLIQNLRITYGYSDSKMKLLFDVDDVNIDVEKAVPLGLIINELVTNSFKYAFPNHPYPVLNIEMKKVNEHQLHLKVEDNGKGLPENYETKSDGTGMIILKDMVRDLKSHLMVKNENGASFELSISI